MAVPTREFRGSRAETVLPPIQGEPIQSLWGGGGGKGGGRGGGSGGGAFDSLYPLLIQATTGSF